MNVVIKKKQVSGLEYLVKELLWNCCATFRMKLCCLLSTCGRNQYCPATKDEMLLKFKVNLRKPYLG